MNKLHSRKFARIITLAGVLLSSTAAFFTVSVQPAAAECKYGGPHCIGKSIPGPSGPGGAHIPGTGWQDPDCKAFGNCDSSELKGTEIARRPTGNQTASIGGGHMKH
jgi:hypothetical protein